MSSVRVEAIAFRDHRYARLGVLIGGNRFTALGAMAHVWDVLQERYRPERGDSNYRLTAHDLAAIFEGFRWAKRFGEHMHAAELAEPEADGFRIRGSRGRIEWLHAKRAGARIGGHARAKAASRKDGAFCENPPAERQPKAGGDLVRNGPADASPSASASASALEIDPTPRLKGGLLVDQATARKTRGPAHRSPSNGRGSLTGSQIRKLVAERTRLRDNLRDLDPASELYRLTVARDAEITALLDEQYPEHADGAA